MTSFDKLDFCRDHGERELLVLDWTTRAVRVIDLQRGHAERPDSAVLGMTTRELVDGGPAVPRHSRPVAVVALTLSAPRPSAPP